MPQMWRSHSKVWRRTDSSKLCHLFQNYEHYEISLIFIKSYGSHLKNSTIGLNEISLIFVKTYGSHLKNSTIGLITLVNINR